MPPSKLAAAGYPRFVNIALATRGKTPARIFRPAVVSISAYQGMDRESIQNDCAAIAELA